MKKILFFCIFIGITCAVFLVNINSSENAVRNMTGWNLKPGVKIETIRKRWNLAWGRTIWILNVKYLTDEDKNMFKPCKSILGNGVLNRLPELAQKMNSKDSFCVVSKEKEDEFINLYLGSKWAIVHFAI